jgi:hypothetical protein
MVKCRVRNFERKRETRVQFSFRVTYGIPGEKLPRIPLMVRQA